VRILLGLLAAGYLAAAIGKLAHVFDLYGWLALSGPKFWSGQVWRLVSYALLPAGVMDFVMNSIALVVLGFCSEHASATDWHEKDVHSVYTFISFLWHFCLIDSAEETDIQVSN